MVNFSAAMLAALEARQTGRPGRADKPTPAPHCPGCPDRPERGSEEIYCWRHRPWPANALASGTDMYF